MSSMMSVCRLVAVAVAMSILNDAFGEDRSAFLLRDAVVVYADGKAGAPPAAVDLTNVLHKVTGANILLVPETAHGGRHPAAAIYLGATRAAASDGIDVGALRRAEFRMKVTRGAAYLAANTDMATSFAMTEFVKRFTDYRFLTLTGDDPYTPNPNAAAIPCDVTIGPRFYSYSNSYWSTPFMGSHGQRVGWFRRIRAETRTSELESRYRVSSLPGRCHSQFSYCPPEKYAKTHPEYYLMDVDGKRKWSGNGAQICFSNPDVFDIVYDSLERFIAEDRRTMPANYPLIYDFSQQDNSSYMCKCPSCQKIVARYDRKGGFSDGGDAGLQLQFVNRLAKKIRAKYPDVLIRTFAYVSTEEPPKDLVPEENVIIWLCDLYTRCDHTRPLDHPFNAHRKQLIETWCALAKHVELWDYSLYGESWFGDYPEVFPDAVAADLRFFEKVGLESFYYENHFDSQPFYELNTYVMGELCFGPDRPVDELIDEYCRVYGKGARQMREAIDYLRKLIAENPAKDAKSWHSRNLPWRTIENLDRFGKMVGRAYEAVGDDVSARRRIALVLSSTLHELAVKYKGAGVRTSRYDEVKRSYVRFAEESLLLGIVAGDDVRRVRAQIRRFVELLDLEFADLPDELKGVAKSTLVFIDDRSADNLTPDRAIRVDDAAMESGKTLKIKPYPSAKSRTANGLVGGNDFKPVPFAPTFVEDGKYHWYKVARCSLPLGGYLLLGSYYFPLKDFHVVSDGLDYDPNLCDIWISVKANGDIRSDRPDTGLFLSRIILHKLAFPK